MVDVVTPKTRSRMMAGIQGKNTRPEIVVRHGLHALGYRFRLHRKGLPGCPDLVFTSRRAVIFVNGCFWHGHGCHLFQWPSTRQQWWRDKINGTRIRDRNAIQLLQQDDWRVLTVWECALKGRTRLSVESMIQRVAGWLDGDHRLGEITGIVNNMNPRRKK